MSRMKELWIITAIFLFLTIAGDYLLRKKLKVSTSEKMSKRAKRFEHMGLAILFVGYLVIALKIILEDGDISFVILPFLCIIPLFRAFMEWKYNRKAKRWAMEMYSAVSLSLLFVVIRLLASKLLG